MGTLLLLLEVVEVAEDCPLLRVHGVTSHELDVVSNAQAVSSPGHGVSSRRQPGTWHSIQARAGSARAKHYLRKSLRKSHAGYSMLHADPLHWW